MKRTLGLVPVLAFLLACSGDAFTIGERVDAGEGGAATSAAEDGSSTADVAEPPLVDALAPSPVDAVASSTDATAQQDAATESSDAGDVDTGIPGSRLCCSADANRFPNSLLQGSLLCPSSKYPTQGAFECIGPGSVTRYGCLQAPMGTCLLGYTCETSDSLNTLSNYEGVVSVCP
ncbi:MAG: hypothetical protein ACRENK_14725 [Gemmatimonadaceae bacterium]